MRILAIGAHPDDVDILCGGTLARYADAGHDVVIAVATNGNAGSATLTSDEIGRIRRGEAEASCALIGAELIWLDFDDEWLFDDRPTRTAFIDAYRHAAPDFVITHDPADYHPDHRITATVAEDARIPSAVRLVTTALPALAAIPRMYRMDNVGGIGFEPDLYVDISEVIDIKSSMVAAHESQKEWLREIFGMEYVDYMREGNRRRGREAGVEYAEAFRLVPTYPPARPELPPLGVGISNG